MFSATAAVCLCARLSVLRCVSQYVCLRAWHFVWQHHYGSESVSQSVRQSLRPSAWQSVRRCVSAHKSIKFAICVAVCVCVCASLFICQSHVSARPSLSLSQSGNLSLGLCVVPLLSRSISHGFGLPIDEIQ